ncbi:LOW QUALITY PROTEIN: hypothetical protein BC936DRAFT_143638 [Jimgerdemannia flammicorona]|uniref:Dynamin N-terminal domain-containing protein n=1 Tax=Jimgerdemannia flammicorona TaxID=994334 RepID=A0A433DDN9_9FUNG|nr:LOW QUALITY PROTEIN: hypothetical protein BC936DRAFT_143638 [Jimgerdemannia flammicorona]
MLKNCKSEYKCYKNPARQDCNREFFGFFVSKDSKACHGPMPCFPDGYCRPNLQAQGRWRCRRLATRAGGQAAPPQEWLDLELPSAERLLPALQDERDLAKLIDNSMPNGYIDGLELQNSITCKSLFEQIFTPEDFGTKTHDVRLFSKSASWSWMLNENHQWGLVFHISKANCHCTRNEFGLRTKPSQKSQALKGGRHGPDEIKNYINRHRRKNDNGVTRLAIVGNMKSGKSKFVNALIGSDDLLLMRSHAATTIPTICKHSPGSKAPKLEYNEEPFRLAVGKNRKIIDEMKAVHTPKTSKEKEFEVGVEKIEADTECFSYVEKFKNGMLQLPQSPSTFKIALVLLNDIMRIYIHLYPIIDVSPTDSSSDSPRDSPLILLNEKCPTVDIEFDFIGGEDKSIEIVDSPGPEEITSGELETIVKELLKTCNACFSVLDCTDLGGEAEEKLKYLADEWEVGVANLYVIANQADKLSTRKEEAPEKIRRQIASRFLDREKPDQQVSAKNGRLARNMKKLIDSRGSSGLASRVAPIHRPQ